MKKILVALLFITSGLMASENNVCLEVTGIIKGEKSMQSEASISLFKNGSMQSAEVSDASGKFTLEFEKDNNYEIVISKPGYFPQKIAVNTQGLENDSDFLTYKFQINLFAEIDEIDSKIFNDPIIALNYNENNDDMDRIIDNKTIESLDKFIVNYDNAKEKAYLKTIEKADNEFSNQNFVMAKSLYKLAIEMDPDNYYPDFQLVMIDRIIAKDIRIQTKFENQIAEADQHYIAKEFKKAKKDYQRALRHKEDQYSRDRILKINNALSMEEIYAKK